MKTFNIPVSWSMYKTLKIKAKTLENAILKARDTDLPKDGEYIDGSFEVNMELLELENQDV